MILPEEFIDEIKALLTQKDFEAFLKSYESPAYRGIRVNTLKADKEKVFAAVGGNLEQTPFCKDGYYLPQEIKSIGNLPMHHAGGFYVQEPSAMSAVTLLNVQEGDKVLDLCAAPGGKSTQIAAALNKTGLLWSNEIIKGRAQILLSNIERMGVRNAVVSSCHPETLCTALEGYFDKVLADAPCSGEGMFRKDPDAAKQWSQKNVKLCAVRQNAVLDSACKALKPGGTLVYSTCTYSKDENENVINAFLDRHKDFELVDAAVSFGRRTMEKAVRIFPMDAGEGHFAAKLIKLKGSGYSAPDIPQGGIKGSAASGQELFKELFSCDIYGDIVSLNDNVLILPQKLPLLKGLGVLRAGVLLAELKKNRAEPCHNVFMCAAKEELNSYVELRDEEIFKFLSGEEIAAPESLKGYTGVTVNGLTTGFGKASGGRLKNKYPKGLRLQNAGQLLRKENL